MEDIATKIAMGPFGSDIKTDNFVSSGVPIIRGGNLSSGRFKGEGFVYLTEEKADELLNSNTYPGDIVFTHRGTLGQVGLVPDHPFKRYVVSQSQMKLTCDRRLADPIFIYYFFKSPIGQHALLANTSQTGVPAISRPITSLKAIRLNLPPLPTQRAIASVLGTLDDLIELNRETNEILEEMARALFKSWFVDFDPVRAKLEGRPPAGMDAATAALFPDHFQDSELGQIPKGWEVGRLDQIASILMGLSPNGDSYNADGIGVPLINGPVEFGDYFPVKTKWTEAATRFCCEHDLIFCVRGSTTGKRVVSDGEYGIGRGVCAMRAKDGFHSFLYQTINVGLDRMLEKTTGSVFPSLSAPDVKGFSVLKPSEGVLNAFERVTKPLILSIQENHKESRDLATLRDTLLPKLLSGEVKAPAVHP